jgi:hypothetical protein
LASSLIRREGGAEFEDEKMVAVGIELDAAHDRCFPAGICAFSWFVSVSHNPSFSLKISFQWDNSNYTLTGDMPLVGLKPDIGPLSARAFKKTLEEITFPNFS